MSNTTLCIIKPDALRNKFEGKIIDIILKNYFSIYGMKLAQLSKSQAEKFYEIHKDRPFYADLINFMISGPVVLVALKKENAVASFRKLIGATDPNEAEEGTIRKLFAENKGENAIHGSDSDENAMQETRFFFTNEELL